MRHEDLTPASAIIPLFDEGGCARFGLGTETCRWKCGSQCAHPAPNQTEGEAFQDVMWRYISRRSLVIGAAAAGAALAAVPRLAAPDTARAQSTPAEGALTFSDIPLGKQDAIVVPAGYASAVLIRWGDPLFADAPSFDAANQTAEAQRKQFGYNCDFIGFLPLPFGSAGTNRALLVVNHEYTNPEIMFSGYDAKNPTRSQADVELAAHGVSVVEIERNGGQWSPVTNSPYNRRITGETEMLLTGPAAGHALMQTSEDPSGTRVRGMLNNCAAGKTPWGTVVTCEENFNQYFANNSKLPDGDPRRAAHTRYGLTANESERRWETFYKRFDIAQEPNEPFRFGWAVEIDPYDVTSIPKKRTALGRMKHEGTAFMVGPDGRVGVYTGDDERFDYAYKFVTARPMSRTDRAANADLLDAGTLYVAKFNDDGTGQWLPLVFGQGGLTEANGFTSQADVLIRTRLAADRVGATKMDRPEDIEFNPVNKKVYLVMTNNTNRTSGQVDKANPRANNRHGHIIELTENGNDPTSTRFSWEIFMLCGNPRGGDEVYSAGYPTRDLPTISSPDNLAIDKAGNLWIATDGQPGTLGLNDTIFVVPTDGPERGHLKPFLSAVAGSETAGPELSDDDETFFVSVQHPGEGGTLERPVSRWPDGTNIPRPSVVQVWKAASGGEKRMGS